MSAIDDEIDKFFGSIASLRFDISENKDWMQRYESARKDYPEWVTREGVHIKMEDITDDHLSNLIKFLEKKGDSWWLKACECEEYYRKIKKETPELERELSYMEDISYNCL